MRLPLCFLAVLVSVAPGWGQAQGDPRDDVKAIAQNSTQAFLRKDWDTVLDHTHPHLFRLTGGKEQALQQLTAAVNQLTQNGYTLVKYVVGRPGILQEEGGWSVSFVPVMMTIEGQGRRISSDNYLLALRGPEDDRWYLLDGAMVSPKLLAAVAPPLAGKIALPKRRQPRVTPLGKGQPGGTNPAPR